MLAATGACVALQAPVGPLLTSAVAAPSYDQEMPFVCGSVWRGTSRSSHSPSVYSIDWNRDRDYRRIVLASAAGYVYRVADLGSTSYGRYVMIDHGNDESTVYAHLDTFLVQPGTYVDQGTPIGLLGSTGTSSGPHLHYEQRRSGRDELASFHQSPYVMGRSQASRNCTDVPIAGDWNGDGVDEVGVMRRGTRTTFRTKVVGRPLLVRTFGEPTDVPMVGDWNGNGRTQLGVRRAWGSKGIQLVRRTAVVTSRVGPAGAQPVTGDWDGDGDEETGYWWPERRVFVLQNPGVGRAVVRWGTERTLPVTGDWDGDGRTDVGSYAPDEQAFRLRHVAADGAVTETYVPLSTSPTEPTTAGAARPASGWASPEVSGGRRDPSPDPSARRLAETIEVGVGSLTASALPVAGDWNGDGVTDLGVWDPMTASWSRWVINPEARTAPALRVARLGIPRV